MRALLTGCVMLAAAGCDALGITEVCDTYAAPGIRVFVSDSVTALPVGDALVIAMDGAYADSARSFTGGGGTQHIPGDVAFERPGTYTVTVQHPSYRDWRRTGVRVRGGECHVAPVRLDARLFPRPPEQ